MSFSYSQVPLTVFYDHARKMAASGVSNGMLLTEQCLPEYI